MDITRVSQLRPRSVWDLVDDAFDLYRERFATMAGISAVAFVPAHLLNTLITTAAYSRLTAQTTSSDPSNTLISFLVFLGATLVGQPILLLAQTLQTAATSRAVDRRLTAQVVASGPAWRDLKSRSMVLLGVGTCSAIAIVVSSGITLGIAWVLLAPLWSFVPVCVAIEGSRFQEAFRRSTSLASSNFGRVLGMLGLLYLLDVGLQLGLAVLFQLLIVLIPGASASAGATTTFVGTKGAEALAALLLSPLKAIAVSLLYFDCRVRSDALDIVGLARETGVTLSEEPR